MQTKLHNNVIITLIGKGFEMAILYAIQILLAKSLPTSEFGIYSKWLITVNYTSLIISLGLNYSILFFTTTGKINIWNSLIINVLTYCFFTLLLFGFLFIYDFGLFEKKYFIIYVFFTLLVTTFTSIPMIYDEFLTYIILNLLRRILSLLFLGIIFLRLVIPDVFNVVKFDTLSLFLLILICFFWSVTFIRRRENFDFSINLQLLSSYFTYGIKSISLNFLGLSVYSLDVFIVSYFLDSTSIAYYVIAGSIIKITWFIVDNAGTVVFPKFIRNINEDNETETFKIISLINQFSFLLTVVFTVIFIFYGKEFLTILYTVDYQRAYLATIILLLGSHGMVIYKIYSRYFASRNSFKGLYYSLIIAVVSNVLLNFALIPYFGIEGAAFSSFVSYWLCGLFLVHQSKINILSLFSFQEFRKFVKQYMFSKK